MQGVGSLTASVVGWALIQGLTDPSLDETSSHNHHALNLVWRLCLGLGAVPGIITLYFRVTMHETDKFLASKVIELFSTTFLTYFYRKLKMKGSYGTALKIMPNILMHISLLTGKH